MFWCLQLFFHVLLQFLTSLKLGHCSKLNWPKRVSAVYWLFGTLFYPWKYLPFKILIVNIFAKRRVWPSGRKLSILSKLTFVLLFQGYFPRRLWTSTPTKHNFSPAKNIISRPALLNQKPTKPADSVPRKPTKQANLHLSFHSFFCTHHPTNKRMTGNIYLVSIKTKFHSLPTSGDLFCS